MSERLSSTNQRLWQESNHAAAEAWKDEKATEESGIIYDLRPDCLLCGGELGPTWDFETPRRCTNCGALNIPWKDIER